MSVLEENLEKQLLSQRKIIEALRYNCGHYHNENLRLKREVKRLNMALMGVPQPENCLLHEGVCCYPISDCINCPRREEEE